MTSSSIHRIHVPVDLAAGSEDTLHYAMAWAQLFDAELDVLHVVSDQSDYAFGVDITTKVAPGILDAWTRHARRALRLLVSSAPIRADRVRIAVQVGRPAPEIERYAAAR